MVRERYSIICKSERRNMEDNMTTTESKKETKKSPPLFGFFILVGLGGLFSGLIHATKVFSEFDGIVFADMLFNSASGILNLICAFLFKKRKPSVLWVYGAMFLFVQIYAPLVGRGFNWISFIIMGAVFMILLSFRKEGLFQQSLDP
jgi:hypothetical protein